MVTPTLFSTLIDDVVASAHTGAIEDSTDVLKVALLNTEPNADTDTIFSQVSAYQVSGAGYTLGGEDLNNIASENIPIEYVYWKWGNHDRLAWGDNNLVAYTKELYSSGIITVTGSSILWQSASGTWSPFRYPVLYNETASGRPLMMYYDIGASVTLEETEQFSYSISSSIFKVHVDYEYWGWGDGSAIVWGDDELITYSRAYASITGSDVGTIYTAELPTNDSQHQHTASLPGWTEHPIAREEHYSTVFAFDEDPVQDGIWPNHAWEQGLTSLAGNFRAATKDGIFYASSTGYHIERCVYVSGAARSNQYSKGTVFASSLSGTSRYILGVRTSDTHGYLATFLQTGSNAQIHYASGNDFDLIDFPFTTSPLTTGTELEFRAVSDVLTVLVDGSAAKAVSNSSLNSGEPGLGIRYLTAGDNYSKLGFTAWEGGSFYASTQVSDSTHALKSDNVVLAELKDLPTESSQHTHTTESVSYTVKESVSVDSSQHRHTVGSVGEMEVSVDYAVSDATHNHTSEVVTLTQIYDLAVEESTHSHTSGTVNLFVEGILLVEDSTHGHTSDAVRLVVEGILILEGSQHRHTSEESTLYQEHQLSVNDSTHNLLSDLVPIQRISDLDVNESKHTVTSEEVSLLQVHDLSIHDSTHAHTADSTDLEDVTITIVDTKSSQHRFVSSFAKLVEKSDLYLKRSSHEHTSETVGLEVHQLVIPYDSQHSHTVDKVTVRKIVEISDSHHALTVGTVSMEVHETVEPRGSTHAHTAGAFEIYTTEPVVESVFIVKLVNQRILSVSSDVDREMLVA